MVLDKFRTAARKKFAMVVEQRRQAAAEERAIRSIAAREAAIVARKERVFQAKRVAVQKEKIIAKRQLDKFKGRGKGPASTFNVIGKDPFTAASKKKGGFKVI